MTEAPLLTFITSHPDKAEQLAWHLDYPVQHHNLDIEEIQSLDTITVVTAKAQAAFAKLQQPVLVEDFSLSFHALGKLPGPFIKFFLSELGPAGLCRLLDGYHSRIATAEDAFGYCDADGVKVFNASTEGTIAIGPQGKPGFGTDGIFIPQGHTKTWAEMTKTEQNETSIRRVALKKLQDFLQGLKLKSSY